MDTTPFWHRVKPRRFPRVDSALGADVVVVGGGITGLTAAYLIQQTGRSVVVLERDRLVSGETGRTTAHLTLVTDARLTQLAARLGRESAYLVWAAGLAAIDLIETIQDVEHFHCGFRRVPGYLHQPIGRESNADLEKEARMAIELGLDASFETQVPFVRTPGVRYPDQALFHPVRYCAGLADVIDGKGGLIFENSGVQSVETEPLRVCVNETTIDCDSLVVATHAPIAGIAGFASATLFQTKLFPYTTYAVTGVSDAELPEALFWDTAEPYSYLRIHEDEGRTRAIFGGADNKTGQIDDETAPFAQMTSAFTQFLPGIHVDGRWSGQVIETPDGLPYIGEIGAGQFVATGFAGNGMTFGTLGGMMAADWIAGRENPWMELFAPERKSFLAGAWRYLRENFDFPKYFAKGLLEGANPGDPEAVARGEGAVLDHEGQRVASYRDEDGRLFIHSAICTHLGCRVKWNAVEKTWDCPCHGSRFRATGEVLAGPAERPLDPVGPKKTESSRPRGAPAATR